jgi:hypothetical protein
MKISGVCRNRLIEPEESGWLYRRGKAENVGVTEGIGASSGGSAASKAVTLKTRKLPNISENNLKTNQWRKENIQKRKWQLKKPAGGEISNNNSGNGESRSESEKHLK